MPIDEHEKLRIDLRRVIGRDILYVHAGDTQYHFDSISFDTLYAGNIFMVFVNGAISKLGEIAGKKFVELASKLLKKIEGPTADDVARQLPQIKEADAALQQISAALSAEYLEEFLEGGKKSVERRLISDNFPKAKAHKIAVEFAKVLAQRGKNG